MVGYSRFIAPLVGASLFVTPFNTSDKSKLSINNKLVIKADRGSPAFAALEDLYSLEDLTQKSLLDSKDVQQIELKKPKAVKLEGTKISRNEWEGEFHKIDPSHFVKVALLGERIGVKHFTKKFISPSEITEDIQLASFQPSWSEASRKNKRVFVEKRITSSSPGTLSAAASASEEREVASGQVVDAENVSQRAVASVTPRLSTKEKAVRDRVSSASVSRQPLIARKMIRGQLVLRDGDIEENNNFVFYIERLYDGVVHESGVVDADSGTFEIEVSHAKGILYSELRNDQGHVLAYGELNLSKQDQQEDVLLELYPSQSDFSGRTLSYESYDDYEKPVTGVAQTVEGVEGELVSDKEGYFNEQVFEKGSSFVTASHADEFWSTLSLGVTGKPLYPKLYSKKHIKALSQLADPFGEEIEITSLLTGRITQSGLDQMGVEVRLYGAEYHKPLYFRDRIPHPQAAKTSADGRFAFLNLIDGDYLVQAFKGERLVAQRWFKVKRNHVSFGQLNLSSRHEINFEAQVFPDKERVEGASEIAEFGVDLYKELAQGKDASVNSLTHPELTVFQTAETEKHFAQFFVFSAKSVLHRVTRVEREWLDSFLAQRKSNANRSLGMVVGFYKQNARQDLKRVVLEATTAKTKDSKVYYFDKFGHSVDEPTLGGGFILTDVPPGLHSVIFSSRSNEAFSSKIIMAQGRALSLL